MKPTLTILAAGIGSRYGGIKQIEPVGPSGESILDYSIYDATRAGFGRVIFVLREEIQRDFERIILPRFRHRIACETVVQRLDDLPSGVPVPRGRTKPWGTGHALLTAAPRIPGPFAVLNADDFYGFDSLRILGTWLSSAPREPAVVMAGFRLSETLSPHGTSSRGVCEIDDDGFLVSIREETRIERTPGAARCQGPDGEWRPLTGEETVSLNCWGFSKACLSNLRSRFESELLMTENPETWEFYLPSFVQSLIDAGQASVRVIPTPSRWIGITYPEDTATVRQQIADWVSNGVYPVSLWS